MTQASRGDKGNLRVAVPGFDGLAESLPELVAALHRDLIWRIVSVEQNGNVRDDLVIHEAAVHVIESVADGAMVAVVGQVARVGHVEATLDQSLDEVAAQGGIRGVRHAAAGRVPVRRGGVHVGLAPLLALRRGVGDCLAPVDVDRRHIVVVERLVLVIPQNHHYVRGGALQGVGQVADRPLAGVKARAGLLLTEL